MMTDSDRPAFGHTALGVLTDEEAAKRPKLIKERHRRIILEPRRGDEIPFSDDPLFDDHDSGEHPIEERAVLCV